MEGRKTGGRGGKGTKFGGREGMDWRETKRDTRRSLKDGKV